MTTPGPVVVMTGQLGDARPGGGEGECDGIIQMPVDRPEEATQGVGVIAVAADLGFEHAWGDTILRGVELLHDAADAVAVNVDDGDFGQEGVVAGVGVRAGGAAGIRVGLDGVPESAYGGLGAVDASLRHEFIGVVRRGDGAAEGQAQLLRQLGGVPSQELFIALKRVACLACLAQKMYAGLVGPVAPDARGQRQRLLAIVLGLVPSTQRRGGGQGGVLGPGEEGKLGEARLGGRALEGVAGCFRVDLLERALGDVGGVRVLRVRRRWQWDENAGDVHARSLGEDLARHGADDVLGLLG